MTDDTNPVVYPALPTNMEHADNVHMSGHAEANDATQLDQAGSDNGGSPGGKWFTAQEQEEILKQADEHIRRYQQSKAANSAASIPTPVDTATADAELTTHSDAAASHLPQLTKTEGNAQAEEQALSETKEQIAESTVYEIVDATVAYCEMIQGVAPQNKISDTVNKDPLPGDNNTSCAGEVPDTVLSHRPTAPPPLPNSYVFGRMGAKFDTTLDVFAKNPVGEGVEPSSDTDFTQQIAAHIADKKPTGDHGNQRIGQGTTAVEHGVDGSLGHESETENSGETHPLTARSKMLPSTFHDTHLRYEKPGKIDYPQRFQQLSPSLGDPRTDHLTDDLLGEAARNDRKDQDGFRQPYHEFDPATKAGASAYMLSGTNSSAQFPMKPTRLSSAPPAPGTMNESYGMLPSTPGFVQDMHYSQDDQLSLFSAHSHHLPDQDEHSIAGTLSGNTTPHTETHKKRKATEVFIEDDDDDDDYDNEDGSENDGSSNSGSEREAVSVKSDSYEPSESGDDESDSSEDVPLVDCRPFPDGSNKDKGQPVVVSKSTYRYVDDGDNDEDNEGGIDVQRSCDMNVDEDCKEAKKSSLFQAALLATSRKRSVDPSGANANKAPIEENTEPTESSTPENSASILRPEATPTSEPLVQLSWKLPQYHVEVLPLKSNEDAPEVLVTLPNMVREVLVLTPDHAHQEVHLLENLFIPGQQALAEPETWPRQALLNFHTVSTMVLEAYTSYELGDLHTKGSIAPGKGEDKETAALDATKDEIFFAVMDRWRVGLSEEALRPSYKLIRGAQEFCDIALDVIHHLEDNGFIDGPQMMSKERKERKDKGTKKAKAKADKDEGKVFVTKETSVKKAVADEDTPKKRGRPKKGGGDSPGSAKGKAEKVHRPPVKKKAKTTPAKKAKKEPTISVVKEKSGK